jgi:hypothetical protein
MSKLQIALHLPPAGSYIDKNFQRSSRDLNRILDGRAQQEISMASRLMEQDPSISRTQALSAAYELLERSSQRSCTESAEADSFQQFQRAQPMRC